MWDPRVSYQDDVRLVEGFSDKLLKLMDELPEDWEATCSILQPLGISWGIQVLDPIVKFTSCPIFYSSVGGKLQEFTTELLLDMDKKQ